MTSHRFVALSVDSPPWVWQTRSKYVWFGAYLSVVHPVFFPCFTLERLGISTCNPSERTVSFHPGRKCARLGCHLPLPRIQPPIGSVGDRRTEVVVLGAWPGEGRVTNAPLCSARCLGGVHFSIPRNIFRVSMDYVLARSYLMSISGKEQKKSVAKGPQGKTKRVKQLRASNNIVLEEALCIRAVAELMGSGCDWTCGPFAPAPELYGTRARRMVRM